MLESGDVDVVVPNVVPPSPDISREQADVGAYSCVNNHFATRQVQLLVLLGGRGDVHEKIKRVVLSAVRRHANSPLNIFDLEDPDVCGRATTVTGVVGQEDNIYADPRGVRKAMRPSAETTTITIPYVNPDALKR